VTLATVRSRAMRAERLRALEESSHNRNCMRKRGLWAWNRWRCVSVSRVRKEWHMKKAEEWEEAARDSAQLLVSLMRKETPGEPLPSVLHSVNREAKA